MKFNYFLWSSLILQRTFSYVLTKNYFFHLRRNLSRNTKFIISKIYKDFPRVLITVDLQFLHSIDIEAYILAKESQSVQIHITACTIGNIYSYFTANLCGYLPIRMFFHFLRSCMFRQYSRRAISDRSF